MIPLLVFYAHVVAISAAFTRRWQEDGVAEGFLAVFFMLLIFFVGWSIASFLMKLIMSKEGAGMFLDRDAASLLFLTAVECVFYYFYLKDDSSEKDGSAGIAGDQ